MPRSQLWTLAPAAGALALLAAGCSRVPDDELLGGKVCESHEWGVGACIDGTLLLWGGTHEGGASANGEKITP